MMRLEKHGFRSSFRFQLFFIFTVLTALITIIFCSLYITTEINQKRRQSEKMVLLLANQLAESARLPLFAENHEELLYLARRATGYPEIQGVIISTKDGHVLVDYHKPGKPSPQNLHSELIEVRSNPLGASPENAISGNADTAGAVIGTVRIEHDSSGLRQQIRSTILISCVVALLFWIMVAALSYLILRKVTHSFNELMQGMETLRKGNYDLTIPIISNDEMGLAAATVNKLAATLKQRDEENTRLNDELHNAMLIEIQSKRNLVTLNRSLEKEVNERIQAERMARSSEQTLKNLMDVLPVGVVRADLNGDIEYLNNFFVERFGFSKEEIDTVDNWSLEAFPEPAYREQVAAMRSAAIEKVIHNENEVSMYEARTTCKDGTVLHVIYKYQIANGHLIVVMIDITDRELLQEQLLKTQKLESLGVLAEGIAHNFNNVLTGILGYISLARLHLDEAHKAYKPLENAERASNRAAGMAKQLLAYARGNAPAMEPVSIQQLVEESVEISLLGTKIKDQIELPLSLKTVMADSDQLNQAFNNIIINAVQAMPNGGTLSVCGENISLASDNTLGLPQGDYVKISFTDQGCGIPSKNMKLIFDPYFTTNPLVGTGLGLSATHSIINKHGGHIAVESKVGQGTTITIYLPATDKTTQQLDRLEPAPQSLHRGNGTILVMDDEEAIRNLACDTLQYLGYSVTTCTNGEEAVTLYRVADESGTPFDAAILDLSIPQGMSGKDAAEQILTFDPNAKLIISSGYSQDPVVTGYRKYGFIAAVNKPYTIQELGQKLNSLH